MNKKNKLKFRNKKTKLINKLIKRKLKMNKKNKLKFRIQPKMK